MNKKIAETVLDRAGGYCELCGRPGDLALHHRKLRSQGGEDEPANLVAIHHHCHNLGTNSVHLNPAMAKKTGFIVPSWAEPTEYPLTLSDGCKVLLDNLGGYTYLEEEGENGTNRDNW